MSTTLKELADFLRDENASIHISARQTRGKGKLFFVAIIREVPPYADSTASGDDLERVISMVMGDF